MLKAHKCGQPGFSPFVEPFTQGNSDRVFDAEMLGDIRGVVAQIVMSKIGFVLLIVIRYVFTAIDVCLDCMDKAGYRYKDFFGYRVIFLHLFPIEPQVIAVSEKGMISCVMIPDL